MVTPAAAREAVATHVEQHERIVSDHGAEFTSQTMPVWNEETGVP